MKQQARASSSSLSAASQFVAGSANADEYDPTQFEKMKGVDSGEMEKWIESRQGNLQDGGSITDDDRMYLACEFMILNKKMRAADVRNNVGNLFFYPKDVETVDYVEGTGVTVTLTDGTTKSVGAFVPYGGRDTNGRQFLVDLAEDGNIINGETYVGMPGSFAFNARSEIWDAFSEDNPGEERDGPKHRAHVLKLVHLYTVVVRASIEGSLPKADVVSRGGFDPTVLLQMVIALVAGSDVSGVYKRPGPARQMTIEDEALVQEIMRERYKMTMDFDIDSPGTATADWITPPKAPTGAPRPLPAPDLQAGANEMVEQLTKVIGKAEDWRSTPKGTLHFKGPNRNNAGDETWACAGLQGEFSVRPSVAGPNDGAVLAYIGFLEAWKSVEKFKAGAPGSLDEDADQAAITAYYAQMQAYVNSLGELESAMINAGEAVRMLSE